MLAGNTREDGTECGFGGCLFNRPADRDDSFNQLAPKLGLLYTLSRRMEVYATGMRGFRFPQATELYRLQRQQDVADLKPVILDSLELGGRARGETYYATLAAFHMDKKHAIFRDADGINVSDGKTRHVGLEATLDWQLSARWRLAADATWARHTYRFDRAISGGEAISSGDDVDTAPRRISSLRLRWDFRPEGSAELEWISLGSYFMDAANTAKYGGHNLLALRVNQRLHRHLTGSLRVTNLLNEHYAERADFAFGEFRYQPGRERAVFLELRYGGS
jgi:outer membrane receptor protein involved in Fe transport